jgi:peptidoglycan/xylan/chitin deacetylase (PgdA/CDA1 family)
MNKNVVLLFHSLDDRSRASLGNLGNIQPDIFEKLLRALKKEFDIVGLEGLISCIGGKWKERDRLLAITFDDGPQSYATLALPIMQSLNIPSTCFLVTDCIGDKAIYWRYLFNFCINKGSGSELAHLINKEYGSSIKEKEIISFSRRNFDVSKNRNIITGIFRGIISEEEYRAKEQDLFLSLDDISLLKEHPLVSFGIHTCTHPVMMHLSDKEIHEEILESLNFYKNNISDNIPMFSIPFGRLYIDYDERTISIAQDLLIQHIFSAYGGLNSVEQPVYNIRRIPVQEALLEQGIDRFITTLKEMTVETEYVKKEQRLADALGKAMSNE